MTTHFDKGEVPKLLSVCGNLFMCEDDSHMQAYAWNDFRCSSTFVCLLLFSLPGHFQYIQYISYTFQQYKSRITVLVSAILCEITFINHVLLMYVSVIYSKFVVDVYEVILFSLDFAAFVRQGMLHLLPFYISNNYKQQLD